MADDFAGGIYANIPRLDSHGRSQLPMFTRWNPDPIGNEAKNLASLSPEMQRVIAQARADNPNLKFVLGSGKRSAEDQDLAKKWGWSKVGSKDSGDAQIHMQGNAADLWGLDEKGRVQFNPDQQAQINQAVQDAAKKLGVGISWGGNWKNFKDAPHFELANSSGTTLTSASVPTAGAPPGALAAPTATNNVFETMRNNIGQFESGGNYHILGPKLKSGDQAIGKYQVMASNVPAWTQKWLGQSMTPEQFRASPEAQEAVFKGEFGSYLDSGTPGDAASRWFTGQPLSVGANRKDILGTSGAKYAAIATKGLDSEAVTTRGPSRPVTPTPTTGFTVAATPAPADQPWWNRFVNPPVDAQGKPVEGAKSPLERATATILGGPSEKTREALKAAAPQGDGEIGPPGARNVSPGLAPGAIQQTWGQTLNSFMQPLTWGSAPPGSGFGPAAGYHPAAGGGAAPAVPGMSLASTPYFGNDPNFGAGFQFGG